MPRAAGTFGRRFFWCEARFSIGTIQRSMDASCLQCLTREGEKGLVCLTQALGRPPLHETDETVFGGGFGPYSHVSVCVCVCDSNAFRW